MKLERREKNKRNYGYDRTSFSSSLSSKRVEIWSLEHVTQQYK